MSVVLLLACTEPEIVHGPGGPYFTDDSTASENGTDTETPGPSDDSGAAQKTDAIVLGHTPKNLLVISLDTTRRDRLSFFGVDTTPNLEAAFSNGVILEDHRSCSNWVPPSARQSLR